MVEEAKLTIGSPLTLKCGKILKNRTVKASVAEFYMEGEEGGDHTEFNHTLYKRWAEGGVGMILTGHIFVDRDTKGHISDPVIDEKSSIAAFSKTAEACKLNGCAGIVQLNAAGRQGMFCRGDHCLAPSAVQLKGPFAAACKPSRAMTEIEIIDVIAKFVRSADICKTAGFDGVMIHCAHGYLLSSFLSPFANLRKDKWGGSSQNRSRILMEIINQVREKVGSAFILGLKINSADFQKEGLTEEECSEVLINLNVNPQLDFVELSGGSFEVTKFFSQGITMSKSQKLREGFFIEFATRMTKLMTNIPIQITGGMRSLEGMNKALDEGISLIGAARPFCLDPDWPKKMLNGEIVAVTDKVLDASLNIPYYCVQLHRIGNGLEPDLELDPASIK